MPEGVGALAQRERYRPNREDIARNRAALWDRLMQAPLAPSMFERARALDSTTQGWLELARLARSVWADPDARRAAAADWRQTFFGHPAADQYLAEALGRAAESATPPARVALLLCPVHLCPPPRLSP